MLAARECDGTVALAEATGYSEASVHNARRWLDRMMPDWRGPGTETPMLAPAPLDSDKGSCISGPDPEPALELEVADLPVAEIVDDEPAPAKTRKLAVSRSRGPEPWREYVGERMVGLNGKRSWDLYADVYSPVADRLVAESKVNDLIAITLDYLAAVTGDEIESTDRARVAQLVRKHGKAALHGMNEAIGRTEDLDVGARVRYASAVCKRTMAQIRSDT
jgi:hypothetical protein